MKLLFKNIFGDITLLYKNFIHWNISKIVINIATLLLGVMLSFPILLILGITMYADSISWIEVIKNYMASDSVGLSLMAEIYENLGIIIFEAVLAVLAVVFFILGVSYKNLLLSNLYLKYIDGERIEYTKNEYFNISQIFSYLKVLFLIVLVLLIPVVILVIVFFILIFIFGGVENAVNIASSGDANAFGLSMIIAAIICLLIFAYLAYRLTFSWIILMDITKYSQKQRASFYIKESFRVSSGWKIFKFILFLMIYSLCMIPFDYLGEVIENYGFATFVYSLVIFLSLGGVFEMLIVSGYRRIMLEQSTQIVENKDPEAEKKEVL